MAEPLLDDLDRAILHFLQEDARNNTAAEIARELPASDGTVRNRIEAMEEVGVIEGYVPIINYEKAGYPMKVVFTCTVPLDKRADLAKQILEIPYVVHVQEMMKGEENIRVTVVTTCLEDIAETAIRLNDFDLDIPEEILMRQEYLQPFDHLGERAAN